MFYSPRPLLGHTLVLSSRKTLAWKTDRKLCKCLPAVERKTFPNPRNCVLRRGSKWYGLGFFLLPRFTPGGWVSPSTRENYDGYEISLPFPLGSRSVPRARWLYLFQPSLLAERPDILKFSYPPGRRASSRKLTITATTTIITIITIITIL